MRIDYSIWPLELLERVSQQEVLPDSLDVGYRVLLDKDGVTGRLRSATHRAYVPAKPTETEYRALVEEFWFDTTDAAKALWRNELVFARSFVIEYDIRLVVLTRLLGWLIEIDHGWSLPMKVFGRGIERLLPAETRSELLSTYVGPSIDENWEALFRIVELFRAVATKVGDSLGYTYPGELDDSMMTHLRQIQRLPSAR